MYDGSPVWDKTELGGLNMGISYSAIDVYCASHIYWSMNEAISYWGLNNNENVEDVDVLDVIYSV